MVKLCNEFKKCYEDSVSREYYDPCNVQPVFASVNLQRQRMNPDGTWPDEWQNVPRSKIDYNRDLFKVVEKYSDLPLGGLALYKIQLKNKMNQLDLLQPEGYQVATANDEWLPPEFHRDYIEAQKKDEKQAKDNELALNNPVTTTTETGRRGRGRNAANGGGINQNITGGLNTQTTTGGRASRRNPRGNVTTTNSYDTTNTTGRGNRRRSTTPATTAAVQPDNVVLGPNGEPITNVNQVYEDFYNIILKQDTDLNKMGEPIVLWAQDDTVQPDNTYRYRIRVGVLNPVAKGEGDTIVFWSEPSNVTKPVQIQGKMYFFARDVQQAAKTVTVAIYKLDLGYWFKNEFKVGQGEVIGDTEEVKIKIEDTAANNNTRITSSSSEQTRMINFDTGAVMMDVTPVNELSGTHTLGNKTYYDMMYSSDGTKIEHAPVATNYRPWPEIYNHFLYVESKIKEKQEPLKAWGSNEMRLSLIQSGQYNGMFFLQQ